MTDQWENEGGPSLGQAIHQAAQGDPEPVMDIMQKSRLARGGRGAIEPVGEQKFSDAAAYAYNDKTAVVGVDPSLVVTSPVPYVTNARGAIGELTTRELLEELRLRGETTLAVWPEGARAKDGMVLSAMAGAQLQVLSELALNAMRGQ